MQMIQEESFLTLNNFDKIKIKNDKQLIEYQQKWRDDVGKMVGERGKINPYSCSKETFKLAIEVAKSVEKNVPKPEVISKY